MYESANAGLDLVIDKTMAQLAVYRKNHAAATDDGFVQGLIRNFVDQAARAPHGAGAITMGLSAYRLAVQQLEIDRLEMLVNELRDAIEMREAALQLMWALDDDLSDGRLEDLEGENGD